MLTISVFLASPGDVEFERNALAKVVNELNFALATIAPEKDTRLELKQWRTHVVPQMGRPQQVINEQMGSYDIFVGLMWKRFGSPTGVAESGTEEEFRLAFDRWQHTGRPDVLFYFCQEPITFNDDLEQLRKVVSFRQEVAAKGLIWEYSLHNEFPDIVRTHLLKLVGTRISGAPSSIEIATRVGSEALASVVPITETELGDLARQYDELRTTAGGPERTGKMEAVMTRMRTQAQYAYPLLARMTKSESAGERLIAVAILETLPTAEYLGWLAGRLDPEKEKPFLGYHAALALLYAVRSERISCDLLKPALQCALDLAKDVPETSDRRFALASAVQEYQNKCGATNRWLK